MSCGGMRLAKAGWIEQIIATTPATAIAASSPERARGCAAKPRLFLWNPFTASHSPTFSNR